MKKWNRIFLGHLIPRLINIVSLFLMVGLSSSDTLEPDILYCQEIPIFQPEMNPMGSLPDSAAHLTPLEIIPKPGQLYNGPSSETQKPVKTTNRFSSLADLKYYNYFSHAAECPFTATSSGFANPARTCRPNPLVVKDTKYCETIVDDISDTSVLFSWNKDRKEIIAAFRGTRSHQNVLSDIHTTSFKSQKIKGAKLHNGFYTVANALYGKASERIKWLVKQYNASKIMYCGHSLGGSLATLMLGMMVVNGDMPTKVEYRLITYGMPRIGNHIAADFINLLGIEVTRVVSNADIVAHIPAVSAPIRSDYYIHHMNEVWIKGNETIFCRANTYEDNNCSNSLDPRYNLMDHLKYWDVYYGDWAIPGFLTELSTSFISPSLTGFL